jgi:hypothetical protein
VGGWAGGGAADRQGQLGLDAESSLQPKVTQESALKMWRRMGREKENSIVEEKLRQLREGIVGLG